MRASLPHGSFYLPSSPFLGACSSSGEMPGRKGNSQLIPESQTSGELEFSLSFSQMPELWRVLPPFLWSLLVCQRELAPVPALQEAEPIEAVAGLLAPGPSAQGDWPLCACCLPGLVWGRTEDPALGLGCLSCVLVLLSGCSSQASVLLGSWLCPPEVPSFCSISLGRM